MTNITAEAFTVTNSTLCRVTLAVAAPVLAVALSWGVVDACAFTQHSLMGLYSISDLRA